MDDGAVIERAVLFDKAQVGRDAVVRDSVVGTGAQIGPGNVTLPPEFLEPARRRELKHGGTARTPTNSKSSHRDLRFGGLGF